MNVCLPYTAYVNDVFRCLFHDVGLAFTQAPVPGKYTHEIGKTFAGGTLCPGLADVLGSLCECAYLGADTAMVFTPCAGCSEQRIRQKLVNCLEENGLRMHLVCVGAFAQGNKAFFRWLKENSSRSPFEIWEAQRLFYDCIKSLERFLCLKQSAAEDENAKKYIVSAEKELAKTASLLRLKALLNVFNKKLCPFCVPEPAQIAERQEEPYATGDYFSLSRKRSFCGFFEKPSLTRLGGTGTDFACNDTACRRQKENCFIRAD